MVMKMSPISKTYKSFTAPDLFFLSLLLFFKTKKYKLTFEETKIVSCA